MISPAARAAALPLLAGAALLVGAWALLPPYTGPALNTADRVEFADHVVPGVAVIALSVAALLFARRHGNDNLLFAAGLGIVLAGFWMTATHVPLVLQAARGDAPWGATVYHSLPGLAVLALGVAWAATYRSPPEPVTSG